MIRLFQSVECSRSLTPIESSMFFFNFGGLIIDLVNFSVPSVMATTEGTKGQLQWSPPHDLTVICHQKQEQSEEVAINLLHTSFSLSLSLSGHFVYLEATPVGFKGDKAHMKSSVWKESSATCKLTFWYYISHKASGTIRLLVKVKMWFYFLLRDGHNME